MNYRFRSGSVVSVAVSIPILFASTWATISILLDLTSSSSSLHVWIGVKAAALEGTLTGGISASRSNRTNIVVVTTSNTANLTDIRLLNRLYAERHGYETHFCVSHNHHGKPTCLLEALSSPHKGGFEWALWIDSDAAFYPRYWHVRLETYLDGVGDDISIVFGDSADMNTGVFFVRNSQTGRDLMQRWIGKINLQLFGWDDQHAFRSIVVDDIVERNSIENPTNISYNSCGGPKWSPGKCDKLACDLLLPRLDNFTCRGSLAPISHDQTVPFRFLGKPKDERIPHLAPPYRLLQWDRDPYAFVLHPAGRGTLGDGLDRFTKHHAATLRAVLKSPEETVYGAQATPEQRQPNGIDNSRPRVPQPVKIGKLGKSPHVIYITDPQKK